MPRRRTWYWVVVETDGYTEDFLEAFVYVPPSSARSRRYACQIHLIDLGAEIGGRR